MSSFGAIAEFAIAEAAHEPIAGVVIVDSDSVSHEVGPAIVEGAIGEEGPIATFLQGSHILVFVLHDVVTAGASINETSTETEVQVSSDEIIARARTVKRLVAAS